MSQLELNHIMTLSTRMILPVNLFVAMNTGLESLVILRSRDSSYHYMHFCVSNIANGDKFENLKTEDLRF